MRYEYATVWTLASGDVEGSVHIVNPRRPSLIPHAGHRLAVCRRRHAADRRQPATQTAHQRRPQVHRGTLAAASNT